MKNIMKNLKLSTKLILLTSILSVFLLLTGWVGQTRLSTLNQNNEVWSKETITKVVAAADVRSKLFEVIRSQKNAVLARSDSESAEFAVTSEAAAKDLRRLVEGLDNALTTPNAKDLAARLLDNVDVLSGLNKQCLELTKQNTSIQANAILKKKIIPAVERIVEIADRSPEESPPGANATSPRSSVTTKEVGKLAHGVLVSIALQMITTRGEAEFSQIETETQRKVDAFNIAIGTYSDQDRNTESAIKAQANGFRADMDEFLRLSTADSKAKSIAISLKQSKEITDEILLKLNEIKTMFEREANDGVKASQRIYHDSVLSIVGMTAAGLILGFVASFFVSRSVSRPIFLLKNLAVDMASGNLMSRVNLSQMDEVGELATATDSLADSLASVVKKIKNASSELVSSSSDLGSIAQSLISQSASTSTRANDASVSSVQLSTNISTMSSAAEELSISFAAISAATEEMSVSVGAISSAAEQTSNNVAAVSSAFHAISDAFEQVLGNVRSGAQVASNASHMADSATSTMQLLDRSSTEISKVTETIKMIALQTNLLALNATIEAASAGEAGKGFAVVAHEIKQLANQSARAAEDIATKIEGVQTGTRQAVGVIQQIAGVIKEINASADGISKSVEQQSRAAQTISHNIHEANSGVGQIARSIAEVAATANDMARSIAEATRGANDVSRNVGQAALVASSIADTIGEVSKATIETNRSANGVMAESKDLSQLSIELSQIASQFQIPNNGL